MVHTAFWVLFAGAIVAIPLVALAGALASALWLTLLVLVEVVVLAANRMRCPFTAIAARYTDDRSDNFDIFLPAWLARHNKLVFGALFVLGEALFLWRWLGN